MARGWIHQALFGLVAFAGLRCSAADATKLRLTLGLHGGGTVEQFEWHEDGLMVREGDAVCEIPVGGVWQLVGDLRAGENYFRWLPECFLQCRAPVETGAEAFEALASVNAGKVDGWPAKAFDRAVLIFVWLRAGQIRRVIPVPVGHRKLEDGDPVARVRFLLSATDAAGAPAVLLWRDGEFVAPAARFASPEANRVLAELQLGDSVLLRAALGRPGLASRSGQDSVSLLHLAAGAGSVAALEVLLAQDPRAASRERFAEGTPLDWAARMGRTDAVRCLLAAPGGGYAEAQIGHALEIAIQNGHEPSAMAIIDRERRGDASWCNRPLAKVAIERGLPGLFTRLAGGAADEIVRGLPDDALMAQVAGGNAAALQMLLAHGMNPRGENARMALRLAAGSGRVDLVRVLLAAGAEIERAGSESALGDAVRGGHQAVVEVLFAAGADLNRTDGSGLTPLQLAVFSPDAGLVPWLLQHGAGSHHDAVAGRSPLHLALLWRARPAVHELSAAGARIDLKAPNANAALAAAVACDEATLVARAIEDGWSPQASVEDGWSALDLAEGYGAVRVRDRLNAAGPAPAKLQLVPAGELDSPPIAGKLTLPPDLRSGVRAWPEMRLEIGGVVDTAGRLRCIRVEGCDDSALELAVLSATKQWRFGVAQRSGQAVATRIMLPVLLPAEPRRLFDEAQLESLPLRTAPGREDEPTYLWFPAAGYGLSPIYSMSSVWVQIADPQLAAMVADLATGRPVALPRARAIGPAAPPRRNALVTLTVSRSGEPRDMELTWLGPGGKSDAALRAARQLRFTPGFVGARAVAVRMSQWVPAR